MLRPTPTSRLLVALACCLALLAPAGAAARAATAGTAVAAAQRPVAAPAGLGQTLLRDPVAGLLVAPGGKRDDRERPGVALAGVLGAALAAAGAWAAAARRTDRPARRRAAAAAGARAPPSLQLAPI